MLWIAHAHVHPMDTLTHTLINTINSINDQKKVNKKNLHIPNAYRLKHWFLQRKYHQRNEILISFNEKKTSNSQTRMQNFKKKKNENNLTNTPTTRGQTNEKKIQLNK